MTGTGAIGPYRLERELGSGGMGTVWRAAGPGGDRVALKVVHGHIAGAPDFLQRFLRESELGRAVRHPNVVATLDAGTSDGRHWIALEYVEGQTVRSLVEELGTVPEELCRHIAREVAAGLAAIHEAGLIHRDVKPENILITRDHVVKVMDLGIARSTGDDARLTQTGMFVGSVQYAAPEQFTGGGRGLDARADLHALGATLYELATGVQPFEGADVSETLRNVLHTDPRRAGDLNPQVSPFFEEVVATLVAKAPQDRFESAAVLAEVLRRGESSPWWHERTTAIRATSRGPVRRVRVARETAQYGRDAELDRLRAAFARAADGQGAVVLLEGEAGIGKSRLVEEFIDALARAGNELNALWGCYAPGGAAAGAFVSAWRDQFVGDVEALRAALPEQPLLVPAFAALLRGDAAPRDAEPLTKESLHTVFVRSAQALALRRPTVIIVEDLHFAPDEGRALFTSMALGTAGHRLLLVGTTRPGIDDRFTATLVAARAERLCLARLGAADLVRLLGESLGSASLARHVGAEVALKSDGNPFFALEIVRALHDGRFLARGRDGAWVTTRRIDELRVPPSLAELIQARACDLADADRNLVEVAACVGFEFDPWLVGEVLGLAPIPVLQRLGSIEKRTRIVRAAGKRFVFDHHQLQEQLYGGISEALREQYHAAIGAAIEARSGAASRPPEDVDGESCVAMCEQFLSGGSGARAVRYLDRALRTMAATARHRAAADLAARALAVAGLVEGAARVTLLLQRAERLDFAGLGTEQTSALDEACACARRIADRGALVRALRGRGWHRVLAGHGPAATADLVEAVAEARAGGDIHSEMVALGEAGYSYWLLGRFDEATAFAERQLEAARRCGNPVSEAAAHDLLGNVAVSRGEMRLALTHQELAVALNSGADARRRATVRANLGNTLTALGRYEEARACQQLVLDIARGVGDRRSEMHALGNLGDIESVCDPAGAVTLFEQAVTIAVELGNRRILALVRMNLANSLLDLGRPADAERLLLESCAISAELGDPYIEALTEGNLGAVLAALGRPADALGRFNRACDAAAKGGNDLHRAVWLRHRAEAADELGDPARARSELDASIALLRVSGVSPHLSEALVLRAEWDDRDGDRTAAVAAAREAAAVQPGRPDDARALRAEALLARLGAASVDDVARRLAEHDRRLGVAARMQARLWLWRASGDRLHLSAAKQALDDVLSCAPGEHQMAMRANVRIHREIAAECARARMQ